MSTGIEWTDTTWNPVIGCTPVSPGCLNCYAATMARRLEAMGKPEYAPREYWDPPSSNADGSDARAAKLTHTIRIAEVRNGRAVFTGEVRCLEDRLTDPLRWRKPRRVFVNSMSDLFHESVPFEFIDRVFAVMALCPQHTFQVLTKRPDRMAEYLRPDGGVRLAAAIRDIVGRSRGDESVSQTEEAVRRYDNAGGVLPNVWLGTSAENQATADERIPHLLRCPAAVRFLSCEPLLGPVDLSLFLWCMDGERRHGRLNRLHWVIVGGESGPKARPCDVEWIRSIVRQCKDAGVPCFVKQLGKHPREVAASGPCSVMPWVWDDGGENIERWYKPSDRKGGDPSEWPEDLRVRQWPEVGR